MGRSSLGPGLLQGPKQQDLGSNGRCRKSWDGPEFREMGFQRRVFRGRSWLRIQLHRTFQDSNQVRASGSWESVQGKLPSARKQSSSQWVDIGSSQKIQQTSLWNLASQLQGHGELSVILGGLPTSSASESLPRPR